MICAAAGFVKESEDLNGRIMESARWMICVGLQRTWGSVARLLSRAKS
jgi:hypothetical protein